MTPPGQVDSFIKIKDKNKREHLGGLLSALQTSGGGLSCGFAEPSVTLGTRGPAPPQPCGRGGRQCWGGALKPRWGGSRGSGMGQTQSLTLNLCPGLLHSAGV